MKLIRGMGIVVILGTFAATNVAQTEARKPQFEVASIRTIRLTARI
jgi:hypothetical protein